VDVEAADVGAPAEGNGEIVSVLGNLLLASQPKTCRRCGSAHLYYLRTHYFYQHQLLYRALSYCRRKLGLSPPYPAIWARDGMLRVLVCEECAQINLHRIPEPVIQAAIQSAIQAHHETPGGESGSAAQLAPATGGS
jgi:hypothetical protein